MIIAMFIVMMFLFFTRRRIKAVAEIAAHLFI